MLGFELGLREKFLPVRIRDFPVASIIIWLVWVRFCSGWFLRKGFRGLEGQHRTCIRVLSGRGFPLCLSYPTPQIKNTTTYAYVDTLPIPIFTDTSCTYLAAKNKSQLPVHSGNRPPKAISPVAGKLACDVPGPCTFLVHRRSVR